LTIRAASLKGKVLKGVLVDNLSGSTLSSDSSSAETQHASLATHKSRAHDVKRKQHKEKGEGRQDKAEGTKDKSESGHGYRLSEPFRGVRVVQNSKANNAGFQLDGIEDVDSQANDEGDLGRVGDDNKEDLGTDKVRKTREYSSESAGDYETLDRAWRSARHQVLSFFAFLVQKYRY
jgi:hypothetical protein